MPSTSKKQHNFMEAIAHSASFAKKVGVPQSVGQDFAKADKGRKFSKGGDTMPMKPGMRGFQTLTAPMMQNRGNSNAGGRYMAKGGMAKDDSKEDMKMDMSQDKAMIKKAFKQHDMQEHKGGKGTSLKLSKGGSASSRADGVAQRGKTRGTMC